MTVTLVRHGKTAGNLENRYIGMTDEPLCPQGREELLALGADDEVKEVWVTPLIRTQQTAAILYPKAVQKIAPNLAEMNFGIFETLCYSDMEDNMEYARWLDSGCELPCPNGESRQEFCQRVCSCFEALIEDAVQKEQQTLTLVVHGGTIMAICSAFALPRQGYFDWHTQNGERLHFDLNKTTWAQHKVMHLLSASKETE